MSLSAWRAVRMMGYLLALIVMCGFAARSGFAQTPDRFSQGALSAINGDLGQEIIVGSTNMGTSGAPLYFPVASGNMLPYLVGSTGTGGMENLLKVSMPAPFFSGTTYSVTGAVRASGALTTATSQNGVALTPALWNQALFLPISGTDDTPVLASGTFPTPNWVLVAGDGSNPTGWSSGLITTSSNSNPVVGRYAYAIYHEGGLLDANVAGYPSTSTTVQTASKPSLAYADLTQIGLTPVQVDTLVGWRNYATIQVPGSYTAPDFTLASASNYYTYVLSNSNGYLTPNSATYNGQSDQMFTSRQALINFMEGQLGLSGTTLDILNYLATFTRGLNEPSVVPDPTRPLIQNSGTNGGNTAYGLDNQVNPAFPTVLVSGTFLRNDGTVAQIGQPLVNKRFPLNRLAWITYLGPSANRNIPISNPGVNGQDYDMWQLVNVYGISPAYLQQGTAANIKKYFGLTWQVDTMPSGSAYISFHDNEYKWFYMGHNEIGQSTSGPSNPAGVSISGSAGPISLLTDIAAVDGVYATGADAREPDFFEILKAALGAGSKAKGAMNLATVATDMGTVHPYYYQTLRDTSIDYAIIQLGANIIDQFKVDGYATRIVFNDGVDPVREFRGVENLPYLYRVNTGTLKLRMENPVLSSGETNDPPTPLKDSGVGLIMQIPTIWNPHDANAPIGDPAPEGAGLASSLGTPNFRLIADSAVDPDDISTSTATYTTFMGGGASTSPYQATSFGATAAQAAGSKYTTGPNGAGVSITPGLIPPQQTSSLSPLDPSNSQLLFAVPNNALFREPTVLARPNLPTGSQLQMMAPTGITQYNQIEDSAGKLAYSASNGFISDSPNPLDLPTSAPTNQSYLGISIALFPIEWLGPPQSTGTAGIYQSNTVGIDYYNSVGVGPNVTYRIQYKDPNSQDPTGSWVTYDEKYVRIDSLFLSAPLGSSAGNLTNGSDLAEGGSWHSYVDPRTSRFMAVDANDLSRQVQTPGGTGIVQEWADQTNDCEFSDRPDTNSGYGISDDRTRNGAPAFGTAYAEFCFLQAAGWQLGQGIFRMGLLEQNNPAVTDNGIRFDGDTIPSSIGFGPMYFADPDGVVRGAMGNYVLPGSSVPASTTVGLPLATSYPAGYSNPSGAYQGQSRPYILHRPFRSVAELGYVFSGTPWKNIDFFTPQSGDASLLDVFTINEPPSETTDPNELVAGVVNLNTRQTPVLQAVLAGASVDEVQTSGSANTGFTPLTGAQANGLLTATGTNFLTHTAGTAPGYGPLVNVSELVGRWNSALLSGSNYAGAYTGVSSDLGGLYGSVFGSGTVGLTMQNVDRFRESFIRPLAAVGNTRVWNVMIDLISQTGQYQPGAATLDNFTASSQHRYWLHEAIDRYTGAVLDQSLEPVGPASLSLSGTSVTDNLPVGTSVGALSSSELLSGGTFAYSLVSGTCSNDNASFTVNGNTLQTAAVFDSLAKSSYNILLRVTDQAGFTYDQPVTVNVKAGPYTQWKVANFGANAGNVSVAGDTVDAENDGLPNLLKYALGDSPAASCVSGIKVVNNGVTLTMDYSLSSAATDVTVTASCTSNVSNPSGWTTSGVTQTMLSDNGTTQQWQATVPVNGAGAIFMRLTVARP
jgi:hypothetical protein